MFTVFWFLAILFFTTYSVVWLIDNNGFVVVNWLGYEMQTDVLTILIITAFITVFIILLAIVLTRILAIKFPSLLKYFFKRNYTKNLEKIILKHQSGFDDLSNLLIAIQLDDKNQQQRIYKSFASKIKNNNLNNFILGKIALNNSNYHDAVKYFSKLSGNKQAINMVIEAKLIISLNENNQILAKKYAQQLCKLGFNNLELAKNLVHFFRNQQMWIELDCLKLLFASKLDDYLENNDFNNIKISLARKYYQQKRFLKAYKIAQELLNNYPSNLQVIKIAFKAMAKLKLNFLIDKKIIKLWKNNPNLLLAKYYDCSHRKLSKQKRIDLINNLIAINNRFELGNLALARLYYKLSDLQNTEIVLKKIDPNNLNPEDLKIYQKLTRLILNYQDN